MFRDKGKMAAIRKSIEQKQKKSVLLSTKLTKLYESNPPNNKQRFAINELRVRYTVKQRELMEEGIQEEIDILEDLGNKYGYTIGAYEDLEKEKLKLKQNA